MTSITHRFSTCHRHPTVLITGFCAFCLSERLAGIHSHLQQELRRTKSCSGGRDANSDGASASEPRRWSCDVRARSTLLDLFNDEEKKKKKRLNRLGFEVEVENGNGIEETVTVCDEEEGTKTMKEFIDLELRNSKTGRKDLRSFWHASSMCGEKLKKWRWNSKLKTKRSNFGENSRNGIGDFKKPRPWRLRESQVGEFELGRRSCDERRILVDYNSLISFDAPRASLDGYLDGNKASHRLSPMISVVEDENHKVLIKENDDIVNVTNFSPHVSTQTHGYYSCRRSFDRSNTHSRKPIAEVDELKLMSSNAKVSPTTTKLFYGVKLLITEKELMDRNVNVKSLSDVKSDCVPRSAFKDDLDVATVASHMGFKKFQNWPKVWNKLVQRKEDKLEFDAGDDMIKEPVAQSWQKRRRVVNVQRDESVSQKLLHSFSVSCRNPCRLYSFVNSLGAPEARGNVSNSRQEFTLQRNHCARYSPNNLDTGLLRFYLTPLKSYRRSKSGKSSL